MLVSICICTHNRPDDAEECIAALLPQVDPDRGEIIVVDSASNQDARAALRAFLARAPSWAMLVQTEIPGLSIARNVAVAAARGQWIAFLDDDAVPFADYFANLCSAIGRQTPDVAVFGGRLQPRWPASNPAGVEGRWSLLLSLMDDPSERTTEWGLIFGANIVYRKSALEAFDQPFDPALGRNGTSLLSGEEMKLHHLLSRRGWRAMYVGSMGAEHKVATSRLDRRWVRRRAFWEGITQVVLSQRLGRPYPRSVNVGRQLLKMLWLLPRLVAHDRHADAMICLWQSIGVVRARLFGSRHS